MEPTETEPMPAAVEEQKAQVEATAAVEAPPAEEKESEHPEAAQAEETVPVDKTVAETRSIRLPIWAIGCIIVTCLCFTLDLVGLTTKSWYKNVKKNTSDIENTMFTQEIGPIQSTIVLGAVSLPFAVATVVFLLLPAFVQIIRPYKAFTCASASLILFSVLAMAAFVTAKFDAPTNVRLDWSSYLLLAAGGLGLADVFLLTAFSLYYHAAYDVLQ